MYRRNYPRQMSGWPSPKSATYHSFLPEPSQFRHRRGTWPTGWQTLLLGAPWRISWKCLKGCWAKRWALLSHLRKSFHSFLFLFVPLLFSVLHHVSKDSVAKRDWRSPFLDMTPTEVKLQSVWPTNFATTAGVSKRCLDRAHFSKPCWLAAWSGDQNKASDAQHEREQKSLFLCNESGSYLVRIDFP